MSNKNKMILVPNFSDKSKLQDKTFSEWFNEPKQLKTRKKLVKAIKAEQKKYVREVDRKIIDMLTRQASNRSSK